MISTETSEFKNNLISILSTLENYHGDRKELSVNYVKERLSKSLETYYHEITQTFQYLDYRDDNNLMKKYERVMK